MEPNALSRDPRTFVLASGGRQGITERAASDAAARDEGERTCYHIATSRKTETTGDHGEGGERSSGEG